MGVEFAVDLFAEGWRNVEGFAVSHQTNDVLRSIDDRRAVVAIPEVGFHARPEIGIDGIIHVIGDQAKYFNTTDENFGLLHDPAPDT
jgi:hypothetical protein